MKKIVGVGETLLDVIFKEGQPQRAVPGGSIFNSITTLGRIGLSVTMVTELGQDPVGEMIVDFMKKNGIDTRHIDLYPDGKTPIAMAILDENNNARYSFYKQYPKNRLDILYPCLKENDILIFGSSYSIEENIRTPLTEIIDYAQDRKAIVYYDPNIRKNQKDHVIRMMPMIAENMERATIVRGSDEDFVNIFGESDIEKVYYNHVRYYCQIFICTCGGQSFHLFTPNFHKTYKVEKIDAVSTIGAGDNFNAGVLYGLTKYQIFLEELHDLSEQRWDEILRYAAEFSYEVCLSLENYLSFEKAKEYRLTD